MYELKVIKGLDYRYLVDPEKPEIWRVDSSGNRRLLKSCKQKSGYEVVTIRVNGKPKLFYTHRIVWMAVNNKEIPKGYQINHIDYNRGNNKIGNLEILTIKENLDYSRENRRYNCSERILLLKNNIPVKEFDTHKECVEYTGIPSFKISAYLQGRAYKNGINGYTFQRI